MSLSLSNRQYPMLRTFIDGGLGFFMTIEAARAFDQRPFRSMLVHRWIIYNPRKGGFIITREGREAWDVFQTTGILRKHSELPLTAYFDPTAYGLKAPRKRKAAA